MVNVKVGSHVHQLLQLLSVAGEVPASSLHMLGSERVIKILVHKLEAVQDVRFSVEGQVYHTKVLQASGQRKMRTVRLFGGALLLLDELNPEARAYYMNAFNQHKFSGNFYHVDRNHRVGEAIALAMMAGLEFRPYVLPRLQHTDWLQIVPSKPSFYVARDFKGNDFDAMDKTTFTRIVGAVFYPGGCYAVYNTRNAVMKWSGTGEFKAHYLITALARWNAGLREVNSALLLGNDPTVALKTIFASDKTKRKSSRVDKLYERVHFVPLNSDGIQLLKLLTLPDWNERVLDAVFEPDERPKGYGFMEYDAVINGRYVLSHLDSDLARLIRFREGVRFENETRPGKQFGVVCYPWQVEFLRAYLEGDAGLRIISMEALWDALQ